MVVDVVEQRGSTHRTLAAIPSVSIGYLTAVTDNINHVDLGLLDVHHSLNFDVAVTPISVNCIISEVVLRESPRYFSSSSSSPPRIICLEEVNLTIISFGSFFAKVILPKWTSLETALQTLLRNGLCQKA